MWCRLVAACSSAMNCVDSSSESGSSTACVGRVGVSSGDAADGGGERNASLAAGRCSGESSEAEGAVGGGVMMMLCVGFTTTGLHGSCCPFTLMSVIDVGVVCICSRRLISSSASPAALEAYNKSKHKRALVYTDMLNARRRMLKSYRFGVIVIIVIQ